MGMNNQDVFLISANAEIVRLSRLMNKVSKAYWSLKDRKTPYAKSLHACYLMNKQMIAQIDETIKLYKADLIILPKEDWTNTQ